MKKYLLGIAFLLVVQVSMIAQNHYKIRLQEIESNNPTKVFYNVQLAATDGVALNLAGQNYRLYFDTEYLEYAPEGTQSLLSDEKYTNFLVKNFVSNKSAQGMGPLPFENSLGFLNIGVDLEDVIEGGIILPASGEWVNTTQISFDLKNNTSTIQRGSLVWARPVLTKSYATAFVEIAEWVAKNKTIPAEAETYEDGAFSTATSSKKWEDTPSIYPNPVANHFWIDQKAGRETLLEVWGIDGQQLIQTTIPQGSSHYQVDMRQFPTGMYQLRLTKAGKQHVQLIEKQ